MKVKAGSPSNGLFLTPCPPSPKNLFSQRENHGKHGKQNFFFKKNIEYFYTQDLRQFPGFAVVDVKMFDEITDDFHVFFRNVFVFENQQPILGSHRFQRKGDIFY